MITKERKNVNICSKEKKNLNVTHPRKASGSGPDYTLGHICV